MPRDRPLFVRMFQRSDRGPRRRLASAGSRTVARCCTGFYFTPFRKTVRIWDADDHLAVAAGSVMCLLGIDLGRLRRHRQRLSGWMRWHHYAASLWRRQLHLGVQRPAVDGSVSTGSRNAPTRAQRDAFSGGPLRTISASRNFPRRDRAGRPGDTRVVCVAAERNRDHPVSRRAAARRRRSAARLIDREF